MSDWFANAVYRTVGQPITVTLSQESVAADVPKSTTVDNSVAYYNNITNLTSVTNVSDQRTIVYNLTPVQVFSPSIASLDDARKAGEIAASASYFSQVRAGNLSIQAGAFGGVSQAEGERMPLTSARLLLNADYAASSNDQLFNTLIYAQSSNSTNYASMVYRNAMSLILIDGTGNISAQVAQYNEIVRDDTASGSHDAVGLVHNEYAAINGSAGTITNMYMTLNEASWGGTSAEVVTNFYGWHLEDLSSYVTAGRITNYWNIYAVAGNSAFGGKVRIGGLTAPTETLSLGRLSTATGTLGFYNASSALATILQAGNATAAVTYTLPTAGPAANGCALTSTTAGVMSWSAAVAPLSTEAYVTIGNTSGLSAERALTGTTNQITVNDNGANSTVVLSAPQNLHTSALFQVLGLGVGTTAPATGATVIGDLSVSTSSGNTGVITQSWNSTSVNAAISTTQNGAGDAMIAFILGTSRSYAMGIDNSQADQFVISTTNSAGATLGTTDMIRFGTSGAVRFVNAAVAHGMTDLNETDVFGTIENGGAVGGMFIIGYSETIGALNLYGRCTTEDATRSTAATGYVYIGSQLRSSATVTTPGTNKNILVVAQNATARFILDSDGDSHQDVGTAWTNFDDHDDAGLLTALSAGVSREGDPLRQGFVSLLEKHRDTLTKMKLVTFNDDGHHFVNMSRLTMLLVGAVRQQAERLKQLEGAVYGINHADHPRPALA